MSEEVVMVKVEPPDDFDSNHTSVYQSRLTENGADENAESSNADFDKRNFTCLLCDLVFENRDDLRRHLKVAHASKHYFTMPNPSFHHGKISDSVLNGFSSYVNYRYTCTICGAKFKAFRSYLTHSMSHRGTGSLRHQFDDVRMATILSSGKQYLQDYIESEDGFPASFTCDECKTVFSQRDSYAMHMMMRAMNETCMRGLMEQEKIETTDADELSDKMSDKSSVSPRNLTTGHSETSPHVSIKSLEDVTAKVDQDEYLKSVLDRVFVRDNTKYDRLNNIAKVNDEYKLCTFCGNSFEDQDSLAMHVMSDHAAQIIPNKRKSAHIQIAKPDVHWSPPTSVLNLNLTCKLCAQTFASRDSLAMHVLAHAQDNTVGSNALRLINPLKRLQNFDDFTNTNKLARIDDALDMTNKPESVVNPQNGKIPDEMYCFKCDIRFYAESEFIWHNNNQHSDNEGSYPEPLCLTKQTTKISDHKELSDEPRQSNRVRRNSFSIDDNSRLKKPAPRRPRSAGNVTPSDQRGDAIDEERATDLSMKSSRNMPVAPNLKALSSHEQRIIYSVFGKDLRGNLPVETDKDVSNKADEPRETVPKPQKVEHRVRPQTTKSPLNLSYGHVRPMTSVCGGSPNGEKDGQSGFASLPKDTAMCKYCDILFLNKAIYYLHMGLHNVNNPWQCNVCGKVCVDAVDFAAHVIHM